MNRILICAAFLLLSGAAIFGQTSAFTYQGRLTDGAAAGNGTYEMEFKLFDAVAGGAQVGATVTNTNVAATNGIFTVTLDFGASPFLAGANRFLEIAVKKPSEAVYTTLAPRQQLTTGIYAIQSLNANLATNAQNLNNRPASDYVLITDPRLSDNRAPTPGSGDYIQNLLTTGAAQTSANFNIAGGGRIGTSFSVGGALRSGDTSSFISTSARPWAISGYSGFNGGAVYGRIDSGNNTVFAAVQGEYSGTNVQGAAIRGVNFNPNGTGIIAIGNNSTTIGTAPATGAGLAAFGLTTGVFAQINGTGAGQAIYTDNSGDITRVNYWNGTTLFKIQGAGTVSTVVRDTENKQRVMFAPEAPEVLLEDYGTGQLTGGRAVIRLDPIFAANIAVSERRPLKVFIQLEGDCNGVFVTNKTAEGFEVIELLNGKSNVKFSWHVVANRADEELTGATSADGKTIKRISRYSDLRFPLRDENLPPTTNAEQPLKPQDK